MEPPALIEPPSLLRDPPAIVVKGEDYRPPAKPPTADIDPWARVYNRVLAGETIITESIPGLPKGKYKCFLESGIPKYQVVSEVTPSKYFPVRNASHQCPNCGKSQYRIDGWLPSGEHQHRCQDCGTVWRH